MVVSSPTAARKGSRPASICWSILRDLPVDAIDLVEMQLEHEAVMAGRPAAQRFARAPPAAP